MARTPHTKKPGRKAKPAARRRNAGDKYASGAEVFEKFTGKPATKETRIEEEIFEADDMGVIGPVESFEIEAPAGHRTLTFDAKARPILGSTTDEHLYLRGGDQALSDEALKEFGLDKHERQRHEIVIGQAIKVAYHAKKKFDGFKPFIYVHEFGEEGGQRPTLVYDNLNGLLRIVGGSYTVNAEGIRN